MAVVAAAPLVVEGVEAALLGAAVVVPLEAVVAPLAEAAVLERRAAVAAPVVAAVNRAWCRSTTHRNHCRKGSLYTCCFRKNNREYKVAAVAPPAAAVALDTRRAQYTHN